VEEIPKTNTLINPEEKQVVKGTRRAHIFGGKYLSKS